MGFWTMSPSARLTRRTSSTCLPRGILSWMMPTPPSCARAMAIALSVTLSLPEDTSGMPISIVRVSRVFVTTSAGLTLVSPGSSSTSSKFRASRIAAFLFILSPQIPIRASGRLAPDNELGFYPLKPSATTYISDESARLAGGLMCFTLVKSFFIVLSKFFSVPPWKTLHRKVPPGSSTSLANS